jgi:hypothetical protein
MDPGDLEKILYMNYGPEPGTECPPTVWGNYPEGRHNLGTYSFVYLFVFKYLFNNYSSYVWTNYLEGRYNLGTYFFFFFKKKVQFLSTFVLDWH